MTTKIDMPRDYYGAYRSFVVSGSERDRYYEWRQWSDNFRAWMLQQVIGPHRVVGVTSDKIILVKSDNKYDRNWPDKVIEALSDHSPRLRAFLRRGL